MFVGTHTCAPALVATTINIIALMRYRLRLFSDSDLFIIAFCGILPDILSFHISLADRLSSWTHNIWFLSGTLPIILGLSYWYHRDGWLRLSAACWFSIGSHLLCDAISGGIIPFYPFANKIGAYYVPPVMWIPLDIVMLGLFLTGILFVKAIERKIISYQKP